MVRKIFCNAINSEKKPPKSAFNKNVFVEENSLKTTFNENKLPKNASIVDNSSKGVFMGGEFPKDVSAKNKHLKNVNRWDNFHKVVLIGNKHSKNAKKGNNSSTYDLIEENSLKTTSNKEKHSKNTYLGNNSSKNVLTEGNSLKGTFRANIFNGLRGVFVVLVCILVGVASVSCKSKIKEQEITLPENLSTSISEDGVTLKVYDTSAKTIKQMDLEEYLLGVVAGEMYNTWNIEALKAQAVLARTYTLFFLQNYTSKYDGADISNDVTEAQAYDESRINDSIKRAVSETKGQILTSDGELIEAWFHSNAGGVTTTAKNGLNFLEGEAYTKTQKSVETAENSQNFNWNTAISKSDCLNVLREMGVSINSLSTFTIGETDESGRVKTFKIGGSTIDANTFRIKVGSTKMKSTKITNLVVSSKSVYLEGLGYGHGVGLSQWGSKILADEGKTYDEILNFYFDNIELTKFKLSVK